MNYYTDIFHYTYSCVYNRHYWTTETYDQYDDYTGNYISIDYNDFEPFNPTKVDSPTAGCDFGGNDDYFTTEFYNMDDYYNDSCRIAFQNKMYEDEGDYDNSGCIG